MGKKAGGALSNIIRVIFILMMAWAMIALSDGLVEDLPINRAVGSIIVVAILASVLIVFRSTKLHTGCQRIKSVVEPLGRRKMLLIICLASLVIRTFFIFLFQIDSGVHPDCRMYWSFIQQYVENGCITENVDYAIKYSYTVMLARFFVPFAKIVGTDSVLWMNAYLNILFTIASVLLFDLVCYYKGKDIAFVSVMAWTLFPVGAVQTLLIVHENAFVFLHIVFIWIVFVAIPKASKLEIRIIWLLVAASVIGYASCINLFALVSMIAYLIYMLLGVLKTKQRRNSIAIFILTLVLFVGAYKVFDIYRDTVVEKTVVYDEPYNRELVNPIRWGWYVGGNYDSHGGWNEEDARVYNEIEDFESVEDIVSYQNNLIRERYSEYKQTPLKYVLHLTHKIASAWSDFNPIVFNEGNRLNTFIDEWRGGILRKGMTAVLLVIRIVVMEAMLLCALNALRRRQSNEEDYILYMKLIMIGVTLILLVTEVNQKYGSHLLPLFLVVAANEYATEYQARKQIQS